MGLNQPVGRIPGVGHHPGGQQVAIGVKAVALPIDLAQPVGRIIQILCRIAIDDLLQPVPDRIIFIGIAFAGGVVGIGQAIQIVMLICQ